MYACLIIVDVAPDTGFVITGLHSRSEINGALSKHELMARLGRESPICIKSLLVEYSLKVTAMVILEE